MFLILFGGVIISAIKTFPIYKQDGEGGDGILALLSGFYKSWEVVSAAAGIETILKEILAWFDVE